MDKTERTMRILKLEFVEESLSAVVYEVTYNYSPLWGYAQTKTEKVFCEKTFVWAKHMDTMEVFLNPSKARDLADLIKHVYQVRQKQQKKQ